MNTLEKRNELIAKKEAIIEKERQRKQRIDSINKEITDLEKQIDKLDVSLDDLQKENVYREKYGMTLIEDPTNKIGSLELKLKKLKEDHINIQYEQTDVQDITYIDKFIEELKEEADHLEKSQFENTMSDDYNKYALENNIVYKDHDDQILKCNIHRLQQYVKKHYYETSCWRSFDLECGEIYFDPEEYEIEESTGYITFYKECPCGRVNTWLELKRNIRDVTQFNINMTDHDFDYDLEFDSEY